LNIKQTITSLPQFIEHKTNNHLSPQFIKHKTNNHLSSQFIEHKRTTTTYDVGNPGPGHHFLYVLVVCIKLFVQSFTSLNQLIHLKASLAGLFLYEIFGPPGI
jgi:hypothetical protein